MLMRNIVVPDYIKGLIFDCDGTLVDSMPLHMKAWEHAIREKGGTWDLDFFVSQKGMPEEDIVVLYNTRFSSKLDPSDTVETKHRFFRSRAAEFKPIPHVVNLAVKHQGRLPMAIASGGVRENVELELEAIHIRNFFSVILTADDDKIFSINNDWSFNSASTFFLSVISLMVAIIATGFPF